MKLGEKQVLTIEKQVDFGVYLGTEEEHVLLPKKQVPKGAELGKSFYTKIPETVSLQRQMSRSSPSENWRCWK